MSGLREAAERIARMGRFLIRPADRRLEVEKAAERVRELVVDVEGRVVAKEDWDDFLLRVGVIDG